MHISKFGSKVFVLDKTPNKGKFDPRGIEETFVGYADNAMAYRVWIPSENKIRITRDVRFLDELKSPSQYKDIITKETRNGHCEMLDDLETTEMIQIDPNWNLHEIAHNNGKNDLLGDLEDNESIEEDNVENESDNAEPRCGPGRPRER